MPQSYLSDKDFLYNLSQEQQKVLYTRITALSFDERALESIEGRVTPGGSINFDGDSAVRRTCSLSLVADEVDINNFYWGVSNKFSLEIGVKNNIDSRYPDICWFKQGVYVITSFNCNLANNSYTISISGKDKMCLLNGDIGGSLPASIDFGKIDTYKDEYTPVVLESKYDFIAGTYYWLNDEGDYELLNEMPETEMELQFYTKSTLFEQESLTLQDIIREAVHTYGKEPYSNIIINDLDEDGLELLEYQGDTTLYVFYNVKNNIYETLTFDSELKVTPEGSEKSTVVSDSATIEYNSDVEGFTAGTKVTVDGDEEKTIYTISKIEYGDTVGYRLTNLTYAGDLISSIGETLTSMLDKITSMLGSYEYFYDLDGHFVFQEKPIYSRVSWNSLVSTDGNTFARDNIEVTNLAFNFNNAKLIQKFTNTPAINNIKNDYSIWGTRKSASGAELPIHARYAIQAKPTRYETLDREDGQDKSGIYATVEDEEEKERIIVDWREIIYQMAVDYYKHNQEENFAQQIKERNGKDYPTGSTGYEMFYTDMQGFWRQLYNPFYEPVPSMVGGYYVDKKKYLYKYTDNNGEEKTIEYFEEEFVENGIDVDLSTLDYKIVKVWIDYAEEKDGETTVYAESDYYTDKGSPYFGWHKNVVEAPELLNFWIEFYDQGDSLMQYAISEIGDRPKVVNDSKITSIYFRETPQLLFVTDERNSQIQYKTGYSTIQLSDSVQNLFTISSQGKSAKEEFEELFDEFSYCTEQASITVIPIYYLEPNTIINIYNEKSKINGNYRVSKISLSLSNGGMMTLTCTKIVNPM